MPITYRLAFTKIFFQCLEAGMNTVDSRAYAELELGPPRKNNFCFPAIK